MDQQPYDSSVKALFKEHVEEIVPELLPGAIVVSTLDTEVLRPTMHADRAYRVHYRDRLHVFHLEFQATQDEEIAYRSLVYHASLFREYRFPVISMIIYLFQSNVVESPLREVSGSEELLTFHFKVLELWMLDARYYVQSRIMCMYTFLPAMKHADAGVIMQAIDHLVETFGESEAKLAQQLLWLRTFLERTDMVVLADKQKVRERLDVFEELLEQSEFARKQRALGEEKGKVEGKVEGELLALQRILINVVNKRFPNLNELAQQKAVQTKKREVLEELITTIVVVPDERAAQHILTAP